MPKIGRLGAAVALAMLLAGCRVEVAVPTGGRVISDKGLNCAAGATCVVQIPDTAFNDRFTAVPTTGYTFAGWASGNGYLCGGSTAPCTVNLTGATGNANAEAMVASDATVRLVPVFTTANSARYNRTEWKTLLAGLNTSQYRSNSFLYQATPNTSNCDPGALKSGASSRFLNTVNLIRRLHNLPLVSYDSSFATQMQETALVQLANNYLSHSPATGDKCYSADARTGAGSSNLSKRSSQEDPASYPLSWVNDINNMASLMEAGHRRWVLYPSLGYTSYGQASGYAAMKVFGFTLPAPSVPATLEYVAFPFRDYPYVMVTKGSTPWSLSMVPKPGVSSSYNHFTGATVSVVNASTGAPLTVRSVHTDTRGYGLANFLSWMVDNWQYDTTYTVTIRNIRMQDGSIRTISYPVTIDYASLQP